MKGNILVSSPIYRSVRGADLGKLPTETLLVAVAALGIEVVQLAGGERYSAISALIDNEKRVAAEAQAGQSYSLEAK